MKALPFPWTAAEKALFRRLDAPLAIQGWLNSIRYDPDLGTRSPRWVIREGKANCFEGAIFAAAALRTLGHPPLLVDMRSHNDDDHVLAVFKQNGAWGCIAKSNFTVLRFREPVYRTIRELMMSFFDVYFNSIGEKTLRSFSAPFDLSRFDALSWMTTDDGHQRSRRRPRQGPALPGPDPGPDPGPHDDRPGSRQSRPARGEPSGAVQTQKIRILSGENPRCAA